MAQDSRGKALDDKTRKLAGGKVENGKEHAAYQETQQQLLAIQAEQQQNLAVARAESKASFENNQTLAQAAELGAISAAEAEQAAAMGAQAGAQLNPATQQILSKYGAGQPKFSRSQSHSQQVTKQNITINNNITSNTNNDVKVPANIGGPIQGRPLQFKDPSTSADGGSVGKFKTWISAAFARQNEEGAKRDREYRHREGSLTKSASKMMKKLEDIGKTIGSRMDPRKIGSTWQSQLKTLLLLFGFGYLTSNWTKVLETVSDIEQWVRKTWGYFSGNGEKTFISDIKSFLGAKEGESVFDALKELFIGKDGFLGLLKEYFKGLAEERTKAMKMVKFPDIDLGDLMGTIKNLGLYLGDLLSAMVSGSSGIKSSIERNINDVATKGALEQAEKDSKTMSTSSFKTTSGKEIKADVGIGAILNNQYKGLTRHSIDSEGNLTTKYGAESTVAQASDISKLFLQANSGGKIDSTQLSAGLSRLMKASQDSVSSGNSGIPVQASFLRNWFTDKELSDMLKRGELKNQMYYMVLRKKTDEDNILENTSLTNTFAKEYTEKKLGNLVRKATGNEDSFLGNLYGGYQYLKGAAHLTETAYNKALDNDYRVEYVKQPRDGDEVVDDGKGNARKVSFVEITPKVIQKIADKITGKKNTNIDIKDREFVTDVQKGLLDSAKVSLDEDIERREKYRKTHLTDSDNNRKLISLRNRREELSTTDAARIDYDLDEAYRQYDNLVETEKEIKDRFNEKYKNSRVAAAGRNINNKVYDVSNGLFGTYTEDLTAKKSVDSGELKRRKLYLLKILGEKGLSPAAAAGIIGNLESEGLSLPAGKEVQDSHGTIAMGIAQFNSGGELPKLKEWARKNGLDYKKFETQAQYIAQHRVTNKILKETKGLSPQDSLKKSAIIWGHDFEVFQGYTAADSHGNLIGRGKYISIPVNKKDKHRSDGKLYGDENYTERIQKGLNTYSTYGGTDLSNIKLESSRSFDQGGDDSGFGGGSTTTDEQTKEEEPKSFLDILKEQVTKFITSMGGAFGSASEKVNEITSPIIEEVKKKVIANGYSYPGPITKEFTDYETYLANQDNLPKDLPAGLDYADWKNRVFDMTGSMPQNLDLSPAEAKEELREDSKKILQKFTKPEEPKSGFWESNEVPSFRSSFEQELEDQKYRDMIPLLNDPIFRNSLTAEEIAKIEAVKAKDENPQVQEETEPEMSVEEMEQYRQMIPILNSGSYGGFLSEEDIQKIRKVEEIDKKKDLAAKQETVTPGMELDDETYMKLVNDPIYMSSLSPEARADFLENGKAPEIVEPVTAEVQEQDQSSNPFSMLFDPEKFEKKEDKIVTIVDLVTETNDMLGRLIGLGSVNSKISADIVDAVNQGTTASTNASMNMARSIATQQNNQTRNTPSLQGSKNKSLTGVV